MVVRFFKRLFSGGSQSGKANRLAQPAGDATPEAGHPIVGLVDAFGASGSLLSRDVVTETEYWKVTFNLTAWRDSQGNLHKRRLRVVRTVVGSQMDRWMGPVTADGIVHLRVKPYDEYVLPDEVEQLSFSTHVPPDPELEALRVAQTAVVSIDDEKFGRFILDRALDWYVAKTEWNGQQIALSIDAEGNDDVAASIAQAKQFWLNEDVWLDRLKHCAADHLLELANDWNQESSEISRPEFMRRMTPDSIIMNSDADFSVYFEDGDLFWGHVIIVAGNMADGPKDAQMAG